MQGIRVPHLLPQAFGPGALYRRSVTNKEKARLYGGLSLFPEGTKREK